MKNQVEEILKEYKYGHPSRVIEGRVHKLEQIVLMLAEEIDNLKKNIGY